MCMGVTAATIEKTSRGNLERNESFGWQRQTRPSVGRKLERNSGKGWEGITDGAGSSCWIWTCITNNLQHETDVTIPIETEALKNEGRALVDKGGSMLGWMPSTAALDWVLQLSFHTFCTLLLVWLYLYTHQQCIHIYTSLEFLEIVSFPRNTLSLPIWSGFVSCSV